MWSISLGDKADIDNDKVRRTRVLRVGHRSPICSLAVSNPFAIAVSGDEEGRAMLWDMNRYYVRSTPSRSPCFLQTL